MHLANCCQKWQSKSNACLRCEKCSSSSKYALASRRRYSSFRRSLPCTPYDWRQYRNPDMSTGFQQEVTPTGSSENAAAGSVCVKSPIYFVMKTLSCSCWQITQRRSFSTTRSLTTHLEQASLCPQGPYPTNWIGSAHTAQHSSIEADAKTDCQPTPTGQAKSTTFHLPATKEASLALASCASKMSAFSGHTICSRPCGCRAPFSRPAAAQFSRKPLQCRAQQDQTPRQASDHYEQRDGLGRRQAILSATAAILVPMLPVSASAKIEAPPGTL